MKSTFRATATVTAVGLVQTVVVVCMSHVLLQLIAVCTNLFYHGRFSMAPGPADPSQLGYFSIAVPVLGGLLVGIMARFGSKGIRGHGIPEAMESILIRESRIPKRLTILKPLSAAIAIGSGGPFGAEGPIIATGGAIGSLLGQVLPLDERSRKILLASGAAAGMTAIFGTPLSAILLAIELLLFEFKADSFIPVALCAALANILRHTFYGLDQPFFAMREFAEPTASSFFVFLLLGLVIGVISVFVIKSVYWIEDQFERLPIPWVFWPALGGLVVGILGVVEPRSLGVGYGNITDALQNNMPMQLVAILLVVKFISWAVALGSGTSGGTLAPIMTIGACMGLVASVAVTYFVPSLKIEPQVLALAGMAALFAGCSRALLASVLFSFEATRAPLGIVPILGACSVAVLVSRAMCADSIMTLKIVRRGFDVPHEYEPANLNNQKNKVVATEET